MTSKICALFVVTLITGCAVSSDVWTTAPTCKPVALSPSLNFQIVRWSRGSDDRQRERIRICDVNTDRNSCLDVVEYESGWLPRFEFDEEYLRIEVPDKGVKILARELTLAQSVQPQKLEVRIVTIPPATSADQAAQYENRYGLNESPTYKLVC